MSFLTENWFFLAVALGCIAMHLFGHGHGHGHDRREAAGHEHGGRVRERPSEGDRPSGGEGGR